MKKSADKPKHAPAAKHTLEEVLRSLQDLVRNELAEDNGKQAQAVKPAGRKPRAEKPAAPPQAEGSLPGGIQVELPLPSDKASSPPLPIKKVELEAGAARRLKAPSLPASKPAAGTSKPLAQATIKWDDEIPVLKDAVPVLQNVVTPTAKTASLPIAVSPAERARAIAARAAAELNIELRKAGRPALDPGMIEKLEDLLREALAFHYPNK